LQFEIGYRVFVSNDFASVEVELILPELEV
jgi:hypothetical protein